ncbi:hypothetical protein TNCV_2695971 [Trichonephila clavipes]|nr:hypothetical protein TNCV_2695971 [Trichonephila clavipes]
MRKEIFRRSKQKIKEPTIGNARGHLVSEGRLSGHPENTIRIRANYSTLCQITGVSDSRMAELVGKLYSLRFRIIRIFLISSVLRERYVGDGGLKRTELNLEANRGTRSV